MVQFPFPGLLIHPANAQRFRPLPSRSVAVKKIVHDDARRHSRQIGGERSAVRQQRRYGDLHVNAGIPQLRERALPGRNGRRLRRETLADGLQVSPPEYN